MTALATNRFYKELPVLDSFELISDLSRYAELPDDWHIIVADIVNSTLAVRSGHYKTVNLVGVSIISAMLNIAGEIEIPYIFGGDGASLCIPRQLLNRSKQVLKATRQLARDAFSIELRIGIVPVRQVRLAGTQMLCAKHRVSQYCTQASFAGGGIEYAESLLKSDTDLIDRLNVSEDGAYADYSGLECRWDNVPSPHGEPYP